MTTDSIDLPAYLQRIAFDGPAGAPPTLETLRRVQLAHACAIPFENLDVLLNRGIAIDLASIQRKLIASQRGGYCFEQNTLLLHALRQMGFTARPLSARVRFALAREVTPPRTHVFVRVDLDNVPWLVDVGVGGLTPTAPIRMDTSEPQHTPHESRRIVEGPSEVHAKRVWYHQALIGEQWQDVCEFTGEEMPLIDREVANWWTSTHPVTKFRQNIMAGIAHRDGTRSTLATREYTHRRGAQVLEREIIASSERLLEVLRTRFGLAITAGTVFGLDGL